jgi:hypothetical protein
MPVRSFLNDAGSLRMLGRNRHDGMPIAVHRCRNRRFQEKETGTKRATPKSWGAPCPDR